MRQGPPFRYRSRSNPQLQNFPRYDMSQENAGVRHRPGDRVVTGAQVKVHIQAEKLQSFRARLAYQVIVIDPANPSRKPATVHALCFPVPFLTSGTTVLHAVAHNTPGHFAVAVCNRETPPYRSDQLIANNVPFSLIRQAGNLYFHARHVSCFSRRSWPLQ